MTPVVHNDPPLYTMTPRFYTMTPQLYTMNPFTLWFSLHPCEQDLSLAGCPWWLESSSEHLHKKYYK